MCNVFGITRGHVFATTIGLRIFSQSQSLRTHDRRRSMLYLVCYRRNTMGAIGWRLRKHYFKIRLKPPEKSGNKLVKSGSQSHQSRHFSSGGSNGSGGSIDTGALDPSAEMVLEWLEIGPDKYIEDKELSSILKSLMGLQQPHIEPLIYAGNTECGSQ